MDSLPAYGSTPAENPRWVTATTRTADSPPAYGSTSAGRHRPLRTAESTPDKQTFAHPPLSKRIRTLTAKNKELYEQKVKNFELIITTKWNLVSNHIKLIVSDNRKAVLRDLHSSASHCFDAYDEFLACLVQARGEDSLLHHANITDDLCLCRPEVGDAVSYLNDLIQRHEDE